jgi:sugar-specific transcriptional regulator TrmB
MQSHNELKENLYTALKEIGLTEQEINLYTLSLYLGPASIAQLAKQLGIPRPNAYKLIAALESHGLAKFSERKRFSKTFAVEQPSSITKILRQKKESIARIDQEVTALMPELYTLFHQGGTPTNVKILKSQEEYLETVGEMLNEVDREIRFLGSFDDFIGSITPHTFQRFTSLRIERGIMSKTLVLPTEHYADLKKSEKDSLRELRMLKKSPAFRASFQITKHKVLVWQPITPIALLIEDEYIVEMLNALFTILWDQAGVT